MIRSIFEYIILFMYNMLYNNINYKKPILKPILKPVLNPNTTHVVEKHDNIFDKNLTFYEEDNGPIWF